MGLGCIVTMLPQFLGDKYEYTPVSNVTSIGNSSRATGMCQEDIPPPGDSSCDAEDAESFTRDINMAFYIGYFLAGMGYAPVPTIGVSYIDDYAGKKSPVYIGLIESTWGIGMPCGFLLSAAVLLVYVDFYRVDMATVDLETSDHRWVGAWWIGFAIGAVVFILAALPLFCFPRRLNCKPRITSGVNNGNTVDENEDKIHILADVKGFFYSVWLILTNPVFMLTNLAYSIDKPVGIVLFLPKYFVKDLYYSVSMSNVLMANIPGPIVSGYLLDSTCTQWQTKCGKRGACVAYDNYRFRMIMIGMNILLTGLAFCFYVILAMFLRHRRKHAATGERKFTNSVTEDEGDELQIIGS
ncbi:solute carrier organic anion transporter family member 2A1-like [Glandiceps talaboti]